MSSDRKLSYVFACVTEHYEIADLEESKGMSIVRHYTHSEGLERRPQVEESCLRSIRAQAATGVAVR